MNPYFSIRGQTCPNSMCKLYHQECQRNVTIHSIQMKRFRCQACKKTWVDRKNSPYYRLRGTQDQFHAFEALFEKGESIRSIAHEIQTSTSTIQRWKSRFTPITSK